MEFFNDREPAPVNTHTCHRKVYIDERLHTCSAVYIRVDRVRKGLEPSYTGPFKVVQKSDKYFTIETSHSTKNISLDRLKPAYIADVFDQVDCNDTKTKQFSFSDKSTSVNNTSAGIASESDSHNHKDDGLQTQPVPTSTSSPPTATSALFSPPSKTTRSGRAIKVPKKLNL